MNLSIDNYPGSKGGAGVYQWLINHIPETSIFAEMFAGSGVITEKLCQPNPFTQFYLFEKSVDVAYQLLSKFYLPGNVHVFVKDSLLNKSFDKELFIYADPPYLKETRRDQAYVYEHEWNEEKHIIFLQQMSRYSNAGNKIMISGYDNNLYNFHLHDWKTSTFQTMTRGGVAIEKIWMNYDINDYPLLTTEYLGKNFTDRQRIKRRKESFAKKFEKMHRHEKQAILDYIQKGL